MYNNILVPVMLDENDDHARSYEAAKTLASPNAQMTVIHVNEPVPTYALAEFSTELLTKARSDMRAALDKAAAKLPGAASALIVGHAGREILKYAEDHGVDCIVIASHQPGLSDYFLGSTAGRIVRHATCCVHVLR